MAAKGFPISESPTMVSQGSSTLTPGFGLTVAITVPTESPYTKRIAQLQMDWIDAAGNAVDVSDFFFGDLIGTPGGKLFNFRQVNINGSSYRVDVRLERNTSEWTLTVRRHAAVLTTDHAVTGPAQDTAATFLVDNQTPIVNIGVPAARPITQRPVPLTFEWVYSDGEKAPVENFTLSDISTDIGTLGNFQQATGDTSRYTADLTLPQSTSNTKATITVAANSAQVHNASPAILGPEADTEKTFAIAAPTLAATITGADAVCVLEKEIVSNDILNDVLPHIGSHAGGAFTGVLECERIANYLYMVVAVRKWTQTVDDEGALVIPAKPADTLSNMQAGAALLRCNTTTCAFDVLKSYADVTLAARSLTVHGTTLYFMEGSHYMYTENGQFSDPQWREKVGTLYKIAHPSKTIERLGVNWRSATTTDNPDTETTDYFYGVHGGTASPMLSVDDPHTTDPIIYLLTGYGNFDGNESVAHVGNWHLIQYHSRLNQKISELQTNGRTPFDVLKDIALITNSVIGFENDTFFLRPRDPQKAISDNGSGINATQQTLTAKDLNWGTYPSEGWLLIDDELMAHAGADENGHFANLVRGAEGTTPATHTGNFEVRCVDHILTLDQDTLEMPIRTLLVKNDNRTRRDANAAKLLETDPLLDAHQVAWAHWLTAAYHQRFKEGHLIIDLSLKPTFFLKALDVVYLRVPDRVNLNGTLCQVLEVRSSFRKPPTTAVKLVTGERQ